MYHSSSDIEWKYHIPNSLEAIELLIEYRYKYDSYYMMEDSTSTLAVDGVVPLQEEMILTYITLDSLIEKCNFSNEQLRIIKMSEMGYTQEEIAEDVGILPTALRAWQDTMYKAILEENLRNWRKSTYTNMLKLKTKSCTRCKEELPATTEFFSDDSRNKTGLYSQCKKCRKRATSGIM